MTKKLLAPYTPMNTSEQDLLRKLGPQGYKEYKQMCIEWVMDSIRRNISDITAVGFDERQIRHAFDQCPELKTTIIEDLYSSLGQQNPFYAQNISPQSFTVFNKLVQLGARFEHIFLKNPSLFNYLVSKAFDNDSLTLAYTQALLDNTDFTFKQFTECADTLLHYGANINGATENHQSGGLLHACFSLEKPFINELIEYFESKRLSDDPNTQFDYEVRDKWGNTAFLLAVHTLQEDTALSLLALNKIGIPIGINDAKKGMGVDGNPGKEQITPLLISAALGMDAVFTELCNQKATKTRDERNRGLREYASFNEAELKHLFRGMIFNLERSKKAKHTFLLNLQNKPLYFMGSLLLLSDQTPHKEKLKKFIRSLHKKHNAEAFNLLKHVLRQVKPIRRSKSVLETCIENQVTLRTNVHFLSSLHDDVPSPDKTDSQLVDLSNKDVYKMSTLKIAELTESNQKITKINLAYNSFYKNLETLLGLLEQLNDLEHPLNEIDLTNNFLAYKHNKSDKYFQGELGLVFEFLSLFNKLSKLNLSQNNLNQYIKLFCEHLRLFSACELNLSNNGFDITAVELILKTLSNNIKVLYLGDKALELLPNEYFINYLQEIRLLGRANSLEVLYLSDRTIYITTTEITVTRNQPANPSSISSNPSGFFSTSSYPTFRSSSSTDYCPGVASSSTPSSTTSSISLSSSSSSQRYSDLDFQATEEKRPGFGSSF